MRENRTSGLEGGAAQVNALSLPLSRQGDSCNRRRPIGEVAHDTSPIKLPLHELTPLDVLIPPPRVIQQMELEEAIVRKEEHRAYPVWCERCRKVHYHPFPDAVVKEGLFKERLTALVAYMKDFNVTAQFRIAHPIRDIKYLVGLKAPETKAYGKKLLAKVKAMFKVIHEREYLAPDTFDEAMEQAREGIMGRAQRCPLEPGQER